MKHAYKTVWINGRKVYEHRYVLSQSLGRPLTSDECVDHINGDKRDNRPENLRLATKTLNAANSGSHRDAVSKFKGVSKYKYGVTKPWRARIRAYGKEYSLGYFVDEIEAAKAYDKAAVELFGKFARINNV